MDSVLWGTHVGGNHAEQEERVSRGKAEVLQYIAWIWEGSDEVRYGDNGRRDVLMNSTRIKIGTLGKKVVNWTGLAYLWSTLGDGGGELLDGALAAGDRGHCLWERTGSIALLKCMSVRSRQSFMPSTQVAISANFPN